MVAQPARSMLLTGGWDGTARLWAFDMQGAKGEPQRIAFRERFTFTGHTGAVRAVAMSLVQPIIATAGDDGTVRLWRGAMSRPVGTAKRKGKTLDRAGHGGERPSHRRRIDDRNRHAVEVGDVERH